MWPTRSTVVWVNQRLPSEPTTMNCGLPPAAAGNSVTVPPVVMRPIFPTPNSVNQRFPSGPAVIPPGSLSAVVIGKSVIVWAERVETARLP